MPVLALALLVVLLALALHCYLRRWRLLRVLPHNELLDAGMPDTAAGVERWLNARDESAAPLRDGCMSSVKWASGAGVRTNVCILFLHGWGASPPEIDPVDESIARAFGANLLRYRYTAHGLSPSQCEIDEPLQRASLSLVEGTSHETLRRDAATAYILGRLLGERVVIMGCSTGGVLATWLSEQPWVGAELAALVLLSPVFRMARMPSREIWLAVAWLVLLLPRPMSVRLLSLINGGPVKRPPPRLPGSRGEAQARCWTRVYPMEALIHLIGLIIHVDCCRRKPVSRPLLAFACPGDNAASFAATEEMVRTVPHGELEVVRVGAGESAHVITGSICSPSTVSVVVSRSVEFLSKQLA